MSNTPKTDALERTPFGDGHAAREAFLKHARQLEEQNTALRAALQDALSLAAYYQGVFSNPAFTDRHADAERCDIARKYYAEVLARAPR